MTASARRLAGLLFLLTTCSFPPIDYEGLRCDAERPCIDELVCGSDGFCQSPFQPDAGVDAGRDAGTDAGADASVAFSCALRSSATLFCEDFESDAGISRYDVVVVSDAGRLDVAPGQGPTGSTALRVGVSGVVRGEPSRAQLVKSGLVWFDKTRFTLAFDLLVSQLDGQLSLPVVGLHYDRAHYFLFALQPYTVQSSSSFPKLFSSAVLPDGGGIERLDRVDLPAGWLHLSIDSDFQSKSVRVTLNGREVLDAGLVSPRLSSPIELDFGNCGTKYDGGAEVYLDNIVLEAF